MNPVFESEGAFARLAPFFHKQGPLSPLSCICLLDMGSLLKRKVPFSVRWGLRVLKLLSWTNIVNLKLDCHIADKIFIYDTEHHKENQLQSLKHPCGLSFVKMYSWYHNTSPSWVIYAVTFMSLVPGTSYLNRWSALWYTPLYLTVTIGWD